MWPKLLMQLFELMPHITRLVPMADKYFAQRSATEKANEAAFTAMAEGVRGDLGQVAKAHAGLYRQLQEQSAQLADLSEDVRKTRASIEQQGHRVEALEAKLAPLGAWIKGGISVIVVLLIVVIVLLARAR